MASMLCTNKLLSRPLFRVDGDLAEHYNRCLEKVRGITTSLTSFTIDKRGVSPEIIDEHGPCYLQNGPSHRYMIIVSPEQQNTPLLCEEFSFDRDVTDFFFANCFPAITFATRVDGLYVELDDNVHDFCTADDLLLLRKITLEAHTPSGFLTRARELQGYVKQLESDPELLVAENSDVPRRILALAREIGDVRGYNLTNTSLSIETGSFFSHLFGGVYVFRPDAEKIITTARPSGARKKKPRPQPEKPVSDKPDRFTTIFCSENQTLGESNLVTRIPFSAPEPLISFLLSNNYAIYSADLIDSRLRRIEDEHLLSNKVPVGNASYEERCRALESMRNGLPETWRQLMRLKRDMQLTSSGFAGIIGNYSVEVRKMLLQPAGSGKTDHMVAHLLTRLFPFDYETMLVHNTADLNEILCSADEQRRSYILSVLKRAH